MASFADRIRPWACDHCGQQHISANKQECPKCHTARPGSATAESEAMSGQTTRIYEGEQALQAGIAEMARQGWRVVSQTSFQPPAGVTRKALIGVASALFKPPTKFSVVFERITRSDQP